MEQQQTHEVVRMARKEMALQMQPIPQTAQEQSLRLVEPKDEVGVLEVAQLKLHQSLGRVFLVVAVEGVVALTKQLLEALMLVAARKLLEVVVLAAVQRL